MVNNLKNNNIIVRKYTQLIVFVFLSLLFSFPVIASEVIKVGIYQNKPKVYLDENQKPAGFFPEILNYIAEKEAWQLEYVSCKWNKCLQGLKDGTLDLMMDVAYSSERAKTFEFNKEVVLANWSRIYSRESRDFIKSILDLGGKRVAVLKNSFQLRRLTAEAKKFGIKPVFVEVDNFHKVFSLIEQRQVDAGIVNRLYGAQQKDNFNIYKSDVVLFPSRLHFAATKSKNKLLLQRIDKHLIKLKQDKKSIYYSELAKVLLPAEREIPPLLSLTDAEEAWLDEHPVVRIGVDAGYAPYSFQDS